MHSSNEVLLSKAQWKYISESASVNASDELESNEEIEELETTDERRGFILRRKYSRERKVVTTRLVHCIRECKQMDTSKT